MLIETIEISYVETPLITPFKTALRVANSIQSIIVTVVLENGLKGFGEAVPTAAITGETYESIVSAMEIISMKLIKKDIRDFNNLIEMIQSSLISNNSAKAGIEIALYDSYSKYLNIPLYQFLGGVQGDIITDLTISLNEKEEMLKDSLIALDRGFDCLKIKIGSKDLQKDIETIEYLYPRLVGKCKIRLDVNQAWSEKEAIIALSHLEKKGYKFDLIEQPVNYHNVKALKRVTQNSNYNILADESVFTPEDAIDLCKEQFADLINIKLMKTGGISNAIKIINVASIFNIKCMMGSMLESCVSILAAAHLAIAHKSTVDRIDLDGLFLAKTLPIEKGLILNKNMIVLEKGAGLGIEEIINLKLIKKI